MAISRPQVRPTLIGGWPELAEFYGEHDQDPIDGGLDYLEQANLARKLGASVRSGQTSHLPNLFAAIERCLREGDKEAVDLVVIGLLESLQKEEMTGVRPGFWLPYLGERAGRAWNDIEGFWRSGTPRWDARSRDIRQR